MILQTALQDWLTSFLVFLPKLLTGIIIFVATLFISNYAGKWAQKIVKKKIVNEEAAHLTFTILKWLILITGLTLALEQVDFNVTSFIAGLGVVGFTVGFALQDIAKNFVSGLMLLARQPFSLQDAVKIAEYTGKVKEITVRDTVIETFDGELVIIPNQKVFENPIVNFTASQFRRRSITFGLGYEVDAEKAVKLFLETIQKVNGVAKEPAPTIRAEFLGESAMMFSASFWVDQVEYNLLDVHSEVVNAIKEASDQHGIRLPYPVQTLLVKDYSL